MLQKPSKYEAGSQKCNKKPSKIRGWSPPPYIHPITLLLYPQHPQIRPDGAGSTSRSHSIALGSVPATRRPATTLGGSKHRAMEDPAVFSKMCRALKKTGKQLVSELPKFRKLPYQKNSKPPLKPNANYCWPKQWPSVCEHTGSSRKWVCSDLVHVHLRDVGVKQVLDIRSCAKLLKSLRAQTQGPTYFFEN